MDNSIDSAAFELGMPTQLEVYQQQVVMLSDEVEDLYAELRGMRQERRKLIAQYDECLRQLALLRKAHQSLEKERNCLAVEVQHLNNKIMYSPSTSHTDKAMPNTVHCNFASETID